MSLHLTRRDAVAILTLDRQEVLNALSFALLRDIGVGEEVHHMDDAQISLAIDWLRQREGVS